MKPRFRALTATAVSLFLVAGAQAPAQASPLSSTGSTGLSAGSSFWDDTIAPWVSELEALLAELRLTDATRAVIDEVVAGEYPADAPELVDAGAGTVLVVFGAALRKDGSLPDVLVERLEKTHQIADRNPQVRIVVTGGKPVDGRSEADVMAEWLVEKGIEEGRILREGEAVDTISNARHTASLIAGLVGVEEAVVVTSGNHVRRAAVDLRLALGEGYVVGAVSADEAVSGPLPEWERRAIVRDAVELQ